MQMDEVFFYSLLIIIIALNVIGIAARIYMLYSMKTLENETEKAFQEAIKESEKANSGTENDDDTGNIDDEDAATAKKNN